MDWRHVAVVTHWGFIRGLTGRQARNAELVPFDPERRGLLSRYRALPQIFRETQQIAVGILDQELTLPDS